MVIVVKYDTDEDAGEYARRVCEFHANNDGPLRLHIEVMNDLGMRDPLSRAKVLDKINAMTAPGGEYAYLREDKKFAVSRKSTAEKYGLPFKHAPRTAIDYRMKIAERAREMLEGREHLPASVKEPTKAVIDLVEKRARGLGVGGAQELLEGTREFSAAANFELQLKDEKLEQFARRCAYLEEALLAAIGPGGQRAVAGDD